MNISSAQQSRSTTIPGSTRPGWPELGLAAGAYAVALALGIWWIDSTPQHLGELRGYVSYFVSGVAGILALLAATRARRLPFAAFGLARVRGKWIAIALVVGAVVYWANQFVAVGYIALFGNDTPQADYQAAASASVISLILTLLLGAGLTGLGEEVFFRGVVANVLWRFGPWAGVVVSALLFALVHGVNLVFPLAFTVGLVNAILFRLSGSVWPCVIVHVVYNGISNVGFALVG